MDSSALPNACHAQSSVSLAHYHGWRKQMLKHTYATTCGDVSLSENADVVREAAG
jgi:hypothetical protein